jgi:ADP-heptose:LPS heptosyltransferase
VTHPHAVVLRALGLGDLLTAVPALRGLRRALPDHAIVLAAPAWLAPLIAMIDAVDRQLPVDEHGPLPPSAGGPDLAVNLHGSGPQSHRRLLSLAPTRLLAFHHPSIPETRESPRWDESEREAARWCRLLSAAGMPADPDDLGLVPPSAGAPLEAEGATVVHPGAKSGARRWPAERFAEVARAEREDGRRVLVTGSAEERELARRVAALAGLGEQAVLAGRTDLAALAATISRAGCVVCGDTGVAHLATAMGTPSVLLFGPTSPGTWGPPPSRRHRHRVLWAGRTGDPLAETPFEGLLAITVGDVLEQLAALRPSPTAPPLPGRPPSAPARRPGG